MNQSQAIQIVPSTRRTCKGIADEMNKTPKLLRFDQLVICYDLCASVLAGDCMFN